MEEAYPRPNMGNSQPKGRGLATRIVKGRKHLAFGPSIQSPKVQLIRVTEDLIQVKMEVADQKLMDQGGGLGPGNPEPTFRVALRSTFGVNKNHSLVSGRAFFPRLFYWVVL